MSYEGWIQIICERGHYHAMDSNIEDKRCPAIVAHKPCLAPPAVENHVDDTNCDSFGLIYGKDLNKFKTRGTTYRKCDCCGHVGPHEPATYRIPTQEEFDKLRTDGCFNRAYLCDLPKDEDEEGTE